MKQKSCLSHTRHACGEDKYSPTLVFLTTVTETGQEGKRREAKSKIRGEKKLRRQVFLAAQKSNRESQRNTLYSYGTWKANTLLLPVKNWL